VPDSRQQYSGRAASGGAVSGISSSFGLDQHGLRNLGTVHWNLSVPLLYEHAVRRREGVLGAGGSFVANTGIHTGRSVRDKYIVEEASSKDDIAWGEINRPVSEAAFEPSSATNVIQALVGRCSSLVNSSRSTTCLHSWIPND